MKPPAARTYRRLRRRRLEAALRLRMARAPVRPTEAPSFDPVPPEVVDLATGPFRASFPDLADPDPST